MSRKKILVVDVAAQHSGGAAILKEFFQYVCRYGQNYEWMFLVSVVQLDVPDKCADFIKVEYHTEMKKNLLSRIHWEMKDLRKVIPDFIPDVVLSLQNLMVNIKNVPQIVYMHQSLPFQDIKRFSFLKSDERASAFQQHLMGYLIKKSIKRADGVIVQTPWVKDAVVKKTGVSPNKILVSSPSLHIPDISKKSRLYKDVYECEKPVLFYPALPLPYKNHLKLLQAQKKLREQKLDIRIVLTIDKADAKAKELCKYVNDNSLDVVILGYLKKEELLEIIKHTILVFPSYIETVGLPLVEAQIFDAVILVSDCPYAKDVCQTYEKTIYFNCFDELSIAEGIKRGIELDKNLKRKLQYAIPEMYKPEVTWKKVVDYIEEISCG